MRVRLWINKLHLPRAWPEWSTRIRGPPSGHLCGHPGESRRLLSVSINYFRQVRYVST